MKLWIVVNAYLRNEKFVELEERFEKACKAIETDYEIVTNDNAMLYLTSASYVTGIIPDDSCPVLFWDKDIVLAKALEERGHRVYNSSKAIEICDNKVLTALSLAGLGIDTPESIISPMTYANIGYTDLSFVKKAIHKLGLPVIVKEAYGSFGKQVYKADTYDEAEKLAAGMKSQFLMQKYVESSYGRDIRIQVVGKECLSAMYRYSDNDFRANISNGGKMKPYEINESEKELALKACKAIGLDFAGVDILFGEDDKPLICEINSNAHFKNIDDCTGSDVALSIVEYIRSREGF